MARVLLGNLLYPSQTEGETEGASVCVCVCENVRQIAAWGELGGMDGVLQGKDLLRANFHSAKV